MKDLEKEFIGSTWAINNRTSVYIITLMIALAGYFSYQSLPKEQFPEVVFPQIYVATIYPGVSPTNIENLITRPIEKQIKSISGVKKIRSNSVQDFSSIIVEFNTNVEVAQAKQKVKDAVDKARPDLPSDLPNAPDVNDIDVSEIPIMNVNISGDIPLQRLKDYAEKLKDCIESFPEITRVDLIGALDREMQIEVDVYKMMAADISFADIKNAVSRENHNITAGQIAMDGLKRTLTINGEFQDAAAIGRVLIQGASGATVFLADIAGVTDGYKEKESFARLDGKNVITLNVIKRSGENLLAAADKISALVLEMQSHVLPASVALTITGDGSDSTKATLHDLMNTIVIGFILVTLILMFFMGSTNAFFVALSVPLSMGLAFMVLPAIGFTLNMIVLFAFLLALGIVVDDAIVVIENTHRIFANGKVPISKAAKMAAGEVFLPVLSGTLTTLAPFIPLAFWQGTIGKFMFYLPVTLIITLLASLLVAYVINPVFAVDFMKPEQSRSSNSIDKKFGRISLVFVLLIVLAYLLLGFGAGNFVLTGYFIYCLHRFVLTRLIAAFQETGWPKVQNAYTKMLSGSLQGKRPYYVLFGTIGLLFFSFVLVKIRSPQIVFFPSADPNFIYAYVRLPIGTDQVYTDSITQVVEKRIYTVLGDGNPLVKSVIANVGIGASENLMEGGKQVQAHLGKVTVAFVGFDQRFGASTKVYLDKIRQAVQGLPGTEITVGQEQSGPPTGKPINIEVSGDDFETLVQAAGSLKQYINQLQIGGIEELKSDFQSSKPEIVIDVDRERAGRQGLSTGQIGQELRTAVFGLEVAKFRDNKEDYPIQLRLKPDQRGNITDLMNMKITYRDMNMNGIIRQVPLASVSQVHYQNSYAGISRKNQKRLITLSSNVLSDYNANEVVSAIQNSLLAFVQPAGVSITLTGEQEEQAETGAFLQKAMLIALGLILLILVAQFNSITKPIIILSEILFSITGVLLGFSVFKMDISIIMTGIGVVALAGIVVRNGILIVEFTDLLIRQGGILKEAIIEAGRTRMTPVILTASATILGLIPLGLGLNIDFITLFTELNPHLFFGGDSARFWAPLSWTIIFGLLFATFLTLILVPVLYYLSAIWTQQVKAHFAKLVSSK